MSHQNLKERYPAIAAWIDHGWIEIGVQEMFGFTAMALDCGGMVYQDNTCQTLDESLESLERGLREYMKERWNEDF
ncbi:MAG: hypothetical protein Tsb009_27840 [Planctomycetaceae bacterium]